MAILGQIPRRPGDRSIEALWEYVGEMEDAVRHLSMNIEGDNIRDGAIGGDKLSSLVSAEMRSALQRIGTVKGMIRRVQESAITGVKVSGRALTVTNGVADIPAYAGATAEASGVAGAVPPAASAERGKYLRGDGSWAVPAGSAMGGAIVADMGTIDSLPVTKAVAGVTAGAVCIMQELGTPGAQTSAWTVTTEDGTVTVSGTITGETTLALTFIDGQQVTAEEIEEEENE